VGPLAQLVAHLHDALAPIARTCTLACAKSLMNWHFALASASEQGSKNECRYLLRYLPVLTAPARLQAPTAQGLIALNWRVSGMDTENDATRDRAQRQLDLP
jgi:hypothetical protein